MLLKLYIYVIILFVFITCWICISFFTAVLLSVTFLLVLEVHDRFVPLDGAHAAHHGNDRGAIFNNTVWRRKTLKTKMFKNWNPFRKKSDLSGRKDHSDCIKQESKPSNKENNQQTSSGSSLFSKKSYTEKHALSVSGSRTTSGTGSSTNPRPITLARRGSLKITRIKPAADHSSGHATESFLNKSTFNNSSFKSDRSSNDVSIFNASGPLLGSPFIPQVKQALGFNDTLSPFGSPSASRSRIKRSNTFHYAPTHPTTSNLGSLPVVRLGRTDKHAFVDGSALNSPNTVKIAPPDVQRFPTCRLTSIKERSTSTGSQSQAPDTQAIVSALREGRKRSFVHQEESVFDDVDVNQKSKRRRQESNQSTASSVSMPPMPDNFPDLAQPGYTLTPIDSGGVKRPAAPSQEPFEDHEISLAKRPKKDNKNDPIKSSLRSSKISMLKETIRKVPTRRHSICYPTRQYESKMSEMNNITEEDNYKGNTSPSTSDVSMTSLRNQPTILLSSLKTNEELRKSNDELFSGSNNDGNDVSSAENSMNTSLNSSTSKRLLFDGIKISTKKRLSLYPSLNTSFKKVPVSNVVASAEDYEKDREEEQKRVTEMLKEITEEHENKNKKEEKLSVTKTSTTLPPTTSSSTTTANVGFGSSKLPEASKPQTTLAASIAVTSVPAFLTVNPVTTTTTTNLSGKTLESGLPSSSLGLSALTSMSNLVSTTSSTTPATTATPSNYTFKPVFGAASTSTTATTSVISTTTTTSTPTGLSSKAAGGASSFTLGSGFNVPKTSNVLPGTTTSLLTSTASLMGGFNSASSTTAAFPSMKPTSHTANTTESGVGFTFGHNSSGKEKAPSFAFGQTSQAVTSSHSSSTASAFNFGQTAQATQLNINTGPPSLQSNLSLGQNQASAVGSSSLQSNLSLGQNQTSTGGFGFGGATALSALSALSGLSSAPQVTPTTNPPPYSLNTSVQSSSITSGMPKPVFNFGNTALVQPTNSASSTFGSSSTTNASGSAFGVNTSASTTLGAFQFGTPMTPSTPAAPSTISAIPSFGNTSTNGFSFGQSKPPTTTTQNTTGFSFDGGQLATANSSSTFGTTASSKPFTFGSAQPAPGGFNTSNPPPAFGSTNPSASFGNNQTAQASPFGTGNNNTATNFAGASGSTFGSTQPTAFGNSQQNSSTSVFGQGSSTTAFGNNTPQSTPSFGQSGSIFGSSFGQPSSGQSSNTPAAAPSASFQFGQTTPAKPNNPTPTFGQSNTSQNSGFNFAVPGSTPSFNFGGSSTPGTGSAPAGSFGTPTTPTNLFTPGSVNRQRVPPSRSRRGRSKR